MIVHKLNYGCDEKSRTIDKYGLFYCNISWEYVTCNKCLNLELAPDFMPYDEAPLLDIGFENPLRSYKSFKIERNYNICICSIRDIMRNGCTCGHLNRG